MPVYPSMIPDDESLMMVAFSTFTISLVPLAHVLVAHIQLDSRSQYCVDEYLALY